MELWHVLLRIDEELDEPEYKDMIDWLGDEFDPEKIDLEVINKKLKRIRNA